jgi:signal transduction histidine kinase
MTSGSTYGLRFDNTVGYFALTGENNYKLVEKSDREGFVDNGAYRGFFQIATTCKKFSDDAMEAVRRAQDDYVAAKLRSRVNEAPKSTERSMELVEKTVAAAERIKGEANALREALELGIVSVSKQLKDQGFSDERAESSLAALRSAVNQAKKVSASATTSDHANTAVQVIRNEISESKERMLSLYESAAVGLSARGMTHDLRAHIFEIRKRASAIEALTKGGKAKAAETLPHLRAIRSSCSSIAAAAALIDPLLPRTRAVKESIDLAKFAREYFDHRANALELEGIKFEVVDRTPSTIVRINRGRLLAVIDNLIRNSVYWLKRGEQMLGIDRQKRIIFEVTRDGFDISDSGPGIDPGYEDSIFDMFVSAKPASERGQGLGLFIVTQLLAADGANIALASDRNREGRRNKFVVNLASVIQGAGVL